ncbi:MAG: hypothetical protein WCD53_02545, partial [Microcoleus sp.]
VESVKLSRSGLKMGYSSDVSDKEWEIIEPLLPQKKKTRPPVWTKRQVHGRHILSTQKWL